MKNKLSVDKTYVENGEDGLGTPFSHGCYSALLRARVLRIAGYAKSIGIPVQNMRKEPYNISPTGLTPILNF